MGRRRRLIAKRPTQIEVVELYGLEPFEGCWRMYSYYSFNTTEGEKIWGKAYTLPRYEDAINLHALYKGQKWRYTGTSIITGGPSRLYIYNWDRGLNVSYVIRILPKTYTPIIWVYFHKAAPYNKARKIVNKIKFKALRMASKCAKEDGRQY